MHCKPIGLTTTFRGVYSREFDCLVFTKTSGIMLFSRDLYTFLLVLASICVTDFTRSAAKHNEWILLGQNTGQKWIQHGQQPLKLPFIHWHPSIMDIWNIYIFWEFWKERATPYSSAGFLALVSGHNRPWLHFKNHDISVVWKAGEVYRKNINHYSLQENEKR